MITYREELINKKPGPISWFFSFLRISISQHPYSLAEWYLLSINIFRVVVVVRIWWIKYSVLDHALQSRKRIIIKLYLTLGHPSNHNCLFFFSECEWIVNFRAVQEFKSDFLQNTLVVLSNFTWKLNDHVRISVGYNKSVL
jgi:hypothetical protein